MPICREPLSTAAAARATENTLIKFKVCHPKHWEMMATISIPHRSAYSLDYVYTDEAQTDEAHTLACTSSLLAAFRL